MRIIVNFLKQGGILFFIICIALVLSNRFGYITIIGIFSILVFMLVTIRTKFDKGACTILFYVFFYIVFSYFNGFYYSISTLVLYAIAPLFFYQYGGKIVRNYQNEELIITAWLIIIICYSIDIYQITIRDFISTGELVKTNRVFTFWEDESKNTAATLIGLPMSLGMVGLPMFFLTKNMFKRFCFLIVFVLSIITVLSLLNRTGIIVSLLCFILVIGFKSRNRLGVLFSSFFILSILVSILYYTGIINVDLINSYAERNNDISTMGSRSYRWSDSIPKLLSHPFGWYYGKTYYVHNMWLDIARVSGIIPFLLLVYMSLDCFLKSFKLVKLYDNSLSYMMLGLNVCFFASCFVEPIYGGTHFMLYCMLWGTENTLANKRYILQEYT